MVFTKTDISHYNKISALQIVKSRFLPIHQIGEGIVIMPCIYIQKLEIKMAKAYSLDLRQMVMNHLDKFDKKN